MAIIVQGSRVAGVGKPGLSAYEFAKRGGYTGTEEEFSRELNIATSFSDHLENHNLDLNAHSNIQTLIDEKIDAIPKPDINAEIGAHNEDETAHPYLLGELTAIRDEHSEAVSSLNGTITANATIAENYTNSSVAGLKTELTTGSTIVKAATADDSGNVITTTYETKSDATDKLAEAKSYADGVKETLLNNSSAAIDSIYELADAMETNSDAIEALTTIAGNKSDKGHTHTKSEITDFPTSMPASDVSAWAKESSKPTYTASEIGAAESSHTHAASNITSGTLPISRGGTGVTANPSMLVNLGSTSSASVFASSPRPGVTGTLPVARGGTGKTTAPLGMYALINGSSTLSSTGLADGDYIPIGDVSAATGKKVTLANFATYLKGVISAGTSTQGMSYYIGSKTVGARVWFNYSHWRIVHVNDTTMYLALDEIEQDINFGDKTYSESTIAAFCTTYKNNMAEDSLALCKNVTVGGVTNQVWIPTQANVSSSGFTWYAATRDNCIAYTGGAAKPWLTSTTVKSDHSNYVYVAYYVDIDGGFEKGALSSAFGFRPHVALSL